MTTPNWQPLETFMDTPACKEAGHTPNEFMWMGTAGPIQRYRHRVTRRYLSLDADIVAYEFVSMPDALLLEHRYRPISAAEAIYHVFGPIK